MYKSLAFVKNTVSPLIQTATSLSIPPVSNVRYVDPQAIKWYPGHMQKGMADINSKMISVDVVVEVHDARIPFSGRCQFIGQFGQVKLIFNFVTCFIFLLEAHFTIF